MRKKYWLLLVLLLSFHQNLMAKKIAFLVGVGNVPAILNTAKDIKTIRSLLAKDYDEVIELQDSNANYTKVKKVFESLAKRLTSNDTLFFYYTGHGGRFYHGRHEKDGTDEFLVLSSMDVRGNEVYGGVMIDDELNYHFSRIKAQKILFFDCCHSETMKKGGGGTAKFWHPKGGVIVYRKFDVDPNDDKAINRNYINLSATNRDEDQSEDSDNGGIFTLTLKKALEDRGDMAFSDLIVELQNSLVEVAHKNGASGDFTPSMESDGMNPNSFRVKDIFAVRSKPTPLPVTSNETLEGYLHGKIGGVDIAITGKEKGIIENIPLGDSVQIVSHLNEQVGNLYLLVVKGESYSLVAKKSLNQCPNKGSKKECAFANLASLPPYGVTKVYLIYSKNPLDISKQHTKGFSESLKSQLQHQPFKVGYEVFKTVD